VNDAGELSRVGRLSYIAIYGGAILLTIFLLSLFSKPELSQLFVGLLLFSIGIVLLICEPYVRRKRWSFMWTSSYHTFRGMLGMAMAGLGFMTWGLIVVSDLERGRPIDEWYLYLIASIISLVVGAFLYVTERPKDPSAKHPDIAGM
jgi:hypothetical protein